MVIHPAMRSGMIIPVVRIMGIARLDFLEV
jgi:hypothetical protein